MIYQTIIHQKELINSKISLNEDPGVKATITVEVEAFNNRNLAIRYMETLCQKNRCVGCVTEKGSPIAWFHPTKMIDKLPK